MLRGVAAAVGEVRAPSRPGPIELEFEATRPSGLHAGAERAVELAP